MVVSHLQKVIFVALAFLTALMPDEANACFCFARDFCRRYDSADAVVQATVLARSETDFYYEFTIDIITLFNVEPGVEYPQETTFTTTKEESLCGVNPDIGGQYLFGLYRNQMTTTDDTFATDAEFSVSLCGLSVEWASVDKEELTQCSIDPCDGACDEFEVCLQYEGNQKYYCSDTCADGACADGENCRTRTRSWCRNSGFAGCPTRRVCT